MARVELSRAARSDLHGVYLYNVENFGNDVAAIIISRVLHQSMDPRKWLD